MTASSTSIAFWNVQAQLMHIPKYLPNTWQMVENLANHFQRSGSGNMNVALSATVAGGCTIAAGRERLHNLANRFRYQFPSGYGPVCKVRPGWLSIVERLCADVDAVLGLEGKSRFFWSRIAAEDGRLEVMFPEMDLLECREVIEEYQQFDVPLPWKRFECKIELLIEVASRDARQTCEACGIRCHRSVRVSRCLVHVHTPVPFIE